MSYDSDLNPVLNHATNNELQVLVAYIIKKLSNSIETDPRYQAYPEEPLRYVDLISDEIRRMGGNSFVNLFRGEGVSYHEVVCDVAKKLKVNFNKHSSAERIEELILNKVFEDAWERMSECERQEVLNDLPSGSFSGGAATMTAQTLLKLGAFSSYQIAVIVANAIAKFILGRGLSLAANAGLTRALGVFLGPIGWVVTGIWTAIDIAGPSYKTTIPCVIQVAMIRRSPQRDP